MNAQQGPRARFTAAEYLSLETLEPQSVCICVAGVLWFNEDGVNLAQAVAASKLVTLAGLYCHEGQSYSAHDAAEIREIGDTAAERILNLADRFLSSVITFAGGITGSRLRWSILT